MTDLELTIDQIGLELTETHQPLPPDCCTTWVKAMSYYYFYMPSELLVF